MDFARAEGQGSRLRPRAGRPGGWPSGTARRPGGAALVEGSAFASFPKEHWRQICSINARERFTREIRRRADVVGIFPNRQAVIRLVGAILAERHDGWAVSRRYLGVEALTAARSAPVDDDETVPVVAEAS